MSLNKNQKLRQRRNFVIAGGFFILALLVTPILLPWIFGMIREAKHVYLEEVPEENRGVYLITDRGVMQLYNWQLPLGKFPDDAPILDVENLKAISVVMKHLESADAYKLFEMETGDQVVWQGSERDGRQLALYPGLLNPGNYMLSVPTDDMFGENTYHYFGLN